MIVIEEGADLLLVGTHRHGRRTGDTAGATVRGVRHKGFCFRPSRENRRENCENPENYAESLVSFCFHFVPPTERIAIDVPVFIFAGVSGTFLALSARTEVKMRIKLNVMCLGLLSVSILGLMSCAEQNKNSNSSAWELKSPRFETTSDSESGPISLSSFDDAAKSTLPLALKLTDHLVFSDVEDEVTLRTKTVCTLTEATQAYEKVSNINLTKKISVFEFLPLQILYQSNGQAPRATCRLSILAKNKSGSTHDFGDSVTLNVTSGDKKLFLPLATEDGEMRLAHSLGFVGFSLREVDRVPLPRIAKGHHYWLKCETFNIRAAGPSTLGQLLARRTVDKSSPVDNRNQLCRLFVESGRVIKNLSDYFMLENVNVENLVHNVEMSVAFPKLNRTRQSFRLVTVTFFNQMNKIYYARLSTQNVSAAVTYNDRGRTAKREMVLPLKWNVKSKFLVLQPGQSARVSLSIPLDKVCRPGTFTVQIHKQLPLPMLELMTADPQLQADAKPELAIPMIEPSPLAGVFTAQQLIGAGGPGKINIGGNTCGNYRVR